MYQPLNEPVDVVADFRTSNEISSRCSIRAMRYHDKSVHFNQTFYLKSTRYKDRVTHWMDAVDEYTFYHFKYEIYNTGEQRWTLLTTYF